MAENEAILRYLPAETPGSFARMGPDERGVRGRYFLMVWALDASPEYAWFLALGDDLAKLRPLVAEADDELIEAAVQYRLTRDRAAAMTTYREAD